MQGLALLCKYTCPQWRSEGGSWDSGDDCCERRLPTPLISPLSTHPCRCTSSHTCTHASGHCVYDSDCEREGFHLCSSSCIGSTFPTSDFPNNTVTKFLPGDTCCTRRLDKEQLTAATPPQVRRRLV